MSADQDTIVDGQIQVNSSARLLDSLQVFSENAPIGATAVNRSNDTSKDLESFVIYTFDNFGLILEDVDGKNFTGETFNVDLGPVKEAIQSSGRIDEDSLIRMASVFPNATAAVEVPKSLFDIDTYYQNVTLSYNNTGSESVSLTNNTYTSVRTHRLIFSVFLQSGIFQNQKIDCSKKAIGSIIASLQVNSSVYKLANTSIKIHFQENRQVTAQSCMHVDAVHKSTLLYINYCFDATTCRHVKVMRYQKRMSPYAVYSKLKVSLSHNMHFPYPPPTHPHTHSNPHNVVPTPLLNHSRQCHKIQF